MAIDTGWLVSTVATQLLLTPVSGKSNHSKLLTPIGGKSNHSKLLTPIGGLNRSTIVYCHRCTWLFHMVVMVENSCVSLSVEQTFDSFNDFLAALEKVKDATPFAFSTVKKARITTERGSIENSQVIQWMWIKYSTHITVLDVYILESLAKEVKDWGLIKKPLVLGVKPR